MTNNDPRIVPSTRKIVGLRVWDVGGDGTDRSGRRDRLGRCRARRPHCRNPGNIATAGGCLSSQYVAAWVIARLADLQTARDALFYVAPVGEKDEYVDRAMAHVEAFLPAAASA
jgi:hypothetical protein